MSKIRKCLNCIEPIIGRSDKLFCSPYCKSAYHYKKNQSKEDSFYAKVDKQLKQNRRLLSLYNKSGLSFVNKDKILGEGFNPKFFTHYWKNQKGEVYLFCYEYGFLEKKEGLKDKYVLVKWQSYMESR